MNEFLNLNDLLVEINKDKSVSMGAAARYPVRFILLDDFYYYQRILSELSVQRVDLADCLEYDTSWFGSASLTDTFSGLNGSAVIYPVSEILRFFKQSDASGFLASVILQQNIDNSRIYIPLVGLKEMFLRFWDNYNRKNEGPPVWYLKTDDNNLRLVTVYLCDESIETKKKAISNNRQWLQLWNGSSDDQILTKTPSLKHRWGEFLPNGCFSKETLSDPRSFFHHIYSLSFVKQFEEAELSYWNSLLHEYEENPSYGAYNAVTLIERIIGVSSIGDLAPKALLKIYLDSNLHNRWLINLALNQLESGNGYLNKVLRNVSQYDIYNVVYGLYFSILDEPNDTSINERRELIDSLEASIRIQANRFIHDFIRLVGDDPSRLNLLTGFTKPELEHIFRILVQENNLDELQERIPEIKAYMLWTDIDSNGICSNKTITDYFREYALCKVLNRKTPEFESVLNELNGSNEKFYEWYYSIQPLGKEGNYTIIQFDGVGAEWLPYILYLINKDPGSHNKVVTSVELRRADLPSITQINKIALSENFIRDFDRDIIHSLEGYKYPETLLDEMEKIAVLVKDYILHSPEKEIVITADHGNTCMSQSQFGAVALNKDMDSSHEGRYMKNTDSLNDSSFFISHKDYYIALQHNVLTSVPHRETHGGATPEEVLVPYIKIGVSSNLPTTKYHLTIPKRKLEFSNKILEISISPLPNSIPKLYLNSQVIEGVQKHNVFRFDLSEIESGAYKIKLEIDRQIYSENIEILTGFVEEDLFDE